MKVLVVVDMQYDFIDGSLGTPEAAAIVDKVVEKVFTFDGDMICMTMDTHDNHYADTQEGRLLPIPHCIKSHEGWNVHRDVYNAISKAAVNGVIVPGFFMKPTFGSTELALYLLNDCKDVDEVVFVGLCTDICVISNAMLVKAFLPEAKIVVDAACCAGVTPQSHNNALSAMQKCQICVENWEG